MGGNMKLRISTCIAGIALVAAFAIAPVRLTSQTAQTMYKIVPLDTLGGLSGGGAGINNRGWATGFANQQEDNVSHAALWVGGPQVIDLGALGGPGFNSAVAWPVKSNNGMVVGISDTNEDQQPADNFSCYPFFATGSPTGKVCKGFRWANGAMTALPPFPGGFNSYATAVNNRGEIVGWAENGVQDPTCDTALQTLQFRAVIWEPDGTMRELPPLPGDSTSAATAINDLGQVVGISGACGIAVGGVSAAHSVLWQNGVPTEIPNLGGHSWNTPAAINNLGTVVGFSLPAGQDGTRNFEAFLWTQAGGLQRLGKLPGDIRSEALGVNEKNQVVGLSRGGPFLFRAFIWQNGVISDLNSMTVAGSQFLLFANDINDSGEITGQSFDPNTQAAPAFVGIPVLGGTGAAGQAVANGSQIATLPDKVRQHLQRRLGPLADD
jgi:probable HAF family extracellular repeat protein